MEYVVEYTKTSGPYCGRSYLMNAVRQTDVNKSGSILIINHKLPANLLLEIAGSADAVINSAHSLQAGRYHARNGTLFDQNSTVIVLQTLTPEREIRLAEQFCELYGARAVLICSADEKTFCEVYPPERRQEVGSYR